MWELFCLLICLGEDNHEQSSTIKNNIIPSIHLQVLSGIDMNRPTWTRPPTCNQLEGAKQILAKSLEPHLTKALPARFAQDILLVNN